MEPTHTPWPEPTYTPPDTNDAWYDGQRDGLAAGRQEGRSRGSSEGRNRGISDGESRGLQECAIEYERREWQRGFDEGTREGTYEGDRAGRSQGQSEGYNRGLSEGRQAGLQRAEATAEREAGPPGAARGYDEANRSDAAARGQVDGRAAGEADARRDAINEDFPRGRQAVRDEMEQSPVLSRDEFSQLAPTAADPVTATGSFVRSRMKSMSLVSDSPGGMSLFNRDYPTPEERAAYQRGYRSGYDSGYSEAYQDTYDRAYREVYDSSYQRGCQQARNGNYRDDYDRGYYEGRTQAYNEAFRRAYDFSYRAAYDPAFRSAEQDAYDQNYAEFYRRAFEDARTRAYAERTGELYRQAFDRAREARYAELRPGFGEQEFQRGRAEELRDFEERPLRLLDAQVVETNANGLMEPNEALRLQLSLRNFSKSTIDGKQVLLQLDALDENAVVVSSRQMPLAHDLRPQSITSVKDAFEFLMKDSAVGRTVAVRLKVLFRDRNAGEKDLTVRARYALEIQLTGAPEFRNSLETTLRLTLKNVSQAATEPVLKLSLSGGASDLLLPVTEQTVAGLAAGESRVVEFPIATRTSEAAVALSIQATVTNASQRKLGIQPVTQSIPVICDYKIVGRGGTEDLRASGTAKLKFQVHNNEPAEVNRKLAVRLSFFKPDGSVANITVVGNNPLELIRINKGKALALTLPVRVNQANSGGVVQMELLTEGRVILIHRQNF
ncbi:MAG: hypothetical protein NDJ89_01890 [Oligoflexia bacterium]|nr:hypothetical protein [Oligoflexia bacterium]